MKIGPHNISPNVILAPMSGVTNCCFRRLIKRLNPGAVGLVVTEFVSIEALIRKNERSLQMLRFHQEERPISIQIFGNDIVHMVEAAKMAEQAGADIVDINCGCPVPKVVRRGGGCELMRRPEHLAKLLVSVRNAIAVPLTLKIRAGWDSTSRNALEIATLAEDCGISMLAVHGRTRSEMYRGVADWELVRSIAKSVGIPVVGSGDVHDGQSAHAALEGIAGIMIGRASLSNPWIFSEIAAWKKGEKWQAPSALATIDVLLEYRDLLLEEFPERAVIGRLKQLSSQVTRRVSRSAEVRRNLCLSKNVEEFSSVLLRWQEEICGAGVELNFSLNSICQSSHVGNAI